MRFPIACMLCLPALLAAADAPMVSVARWPGDRTSAVSLTFDDAMNTHLDNAAPVLRKHGLKGTFFVATGMGPWEKRLPEWRQLAAQGHEIASHTVNHPCLLDRIKPHSQDYTPAMMQRELEESAKTIDAAIGARRGLTFAWPCGDMTFGPVADHVRNQALYFTYVSEKYFAARAYKSEGGQNPDDINPLVIHDVGVTEGKSGAELQQIAEPILRNGYWAVFCFHGVGGEWLSTPAESLDALAASLEKDTSVWTATFADAIRYTEERRALRMTTSGPKDGVITAALEWPLNRAIYDVPLTLKVQLPGAGSKVSVSVDGRHTPAAVSGTTVLVDVPPGASKIEVDYR